MSAMREKDSADFDLESFIDLFDEALTSDDPSVQKTLQHLMVIAALARNHQKHSHVNGPLRRLFEDVRHLNQRLGHLELQRSQIPSPGTYPTTNPFPSPVTWPPAPTTTGPIWTTPGTTTQWPPAPGTYPPGTIFGYGNTTAASVSQSSMLERVDDLLRDEKYKGSSVGVVDVKTS